MVEFEIPPDGNGRLPQRIIQWQLLARRSSREEDMIRHIVLTKFNSETSEDTIAEIYAGLSKLTEKLPGAHNFTGGRSKSPEQIERGFMHGFVIDFDSWADLETYAKHPEHRALGSQLVDHAVGGRDGILVVDLDF